MSSLSTGNLSISFWQIWLYCAPVGFLVCTKILLHRAWTISVRTLLVSAPVFKASSVLVENRDIYIDEKSQDTPQSIWQYGITWCFFLHCILVYLQWAYRSTDVSGGCEEDITCRLPVEHTAGPLGSARADNSWMKIINFVLFLIHLSTQHVRWSLHL